MYTDHFGLTESPFSIAPNPQYLFMSNRHREALAHLLYGVQGDGGFILLTGEVGTGKTTLCRCLLDQIPTDVETAFVLNPLVSATELLATVADEFGFPHGDSNSLKSLTDALNAYLLELHRADRKAVLIIDEAQNLSRDVLEQLRLLTNLETSERKLLQIILLGQPELLDTLAEKSLRQFSQRITARYHLEALDPLETRDYIDHRMSVAGGKAGVFSRSALTKIFRLSQGIPRVINLICDRALLGAYAEDKTSVGSSIVSKAATEVLGPQTRTSVRLPLAVAATLVLGVVATYVMVDQNTSVPALETPTMISPDSERPSQAQLQPAAVLGHQNIHAAYHDLFALWGTAFEDRGREPCDQVLDIGLMCMQRQVTWDQLLEINRPGIIQIEDQYLVLSEIVLSEIVSSEIQGDKVILFAGSEQFELTREEFENRFDGNISMVWRMPPDYHSPLKVHDRGAAVDWLVMQMAFIEGDTPPLETGFTYNEGLEARVRNFQASVGLSPSGIVDPMTWIHINSVEAVSIPTLSPGDRG